jgi:hypothetical protein
VGEGVEQRRQAVCESRGQALGTRTMNALSTIPIVAIELASEDVDRLNARLGATPERKSDRSVRA